MPILMSNKNKKLLKLEIKFNTNMSHILGFAKIWRHSKLLNILQ